LLVIMGNRDVLGSIKPGQEPGKLGPVKYYFLQPLTYLSH